MRDGQELRDSGDQTLQALVLARVYKLGLYRIQMYHIEHMPFVTL